jgi:phosphoenolpyruvate carboxylase
MEQRHLYRKYPSKIIEIDRRLYTEITIIWKTDELKRTKPSPLDEARWGTRQLLRIVYGTPFQRFIKD